MEKLKLRFKIVKLDGDESSRFERFSFVDCLFLRCFILIFSALALSTLAGQAGWLAGLRLLEFLSA